MNLESGTQPHALNPLSHPGASTQGHAAAAAAAVAVAVAVAVAMAVAAARVSEDQLAARNKVGRVAYVATGTGGVRFLRGPGIVADLLKNRCHRTPLL